MTYEETLEKIHSFNVFGSRLGLERMKKLLELLGNPQDSIKIIHVAGTNGKGSVCRYVYTVLNECGYRAGAYFSPYIERFTERIECGGEEISPEDLAVCTEKALDAVEKMMAEGYESPTEFELVTAVGLLYFAQKNADFVVLEVGLGGKGDSTNISDAPLVTAITSISYDHMAQLGNTLEEIAADKAGIIKKNVPAAVCVDDDGAFSVIASAAEEKSAPLIDVSKADIAVEKFDIEGSVFSAEIPGYAEFRDIEIGMHGMHQIRNALCALTMIEEIRKKGYEIPEAALRSGMKKAFQPARFEIMRRNPYMILDGAHNIAGIRALADAVSAYIQPARILLCTGMLADKQFEDMAEELCRLDADLIVTEVPNPRAKAAHELAAVFENTELYKKGNHSINVYSDWRVAAEAAEAAADKYDAVIWAGSLYLIGPVRGFYRTDRKEH